MLGHAPVGFAQDGIVDRSLDDGCLEVVGDDAARRTAPALEGATVQGNPVGVFWSKTNSAYW
jgi:hypothetical protein